MLTDSVEPCLFWGGGTSYFIQATRDVPIGGNAALRCLAHLLWRTGWEGMCVYYVNEWKINETWRVGWRKAPGQVDVASSSLGQRGLRAFQEKLELFYPKFPSFTAEFNYSVEESSARFFCFLLCGRHPSWSGFVQTKWLLWNMMMSLYRILLHVPFRLCFVVLHSFVAF